jgi:hypothetical protein
MLDLFFALMLGASRKEVPPTAFACRNDVEVWCDTGKCAARPDDESTPMDIRAAINGDITVCAYSGCWSGKARVSLADGRLLWTANGLPFSTAEAGAMTADVTLLILPKDGVGFVRAGGFATPALCQPAKAAH